MGSNSQTTAFNSNKPGNSRPLILNSKSLSTASSSRLILTVSSNSQTTAFNSNNKDDSRTISSNSKSPSTASNRSRILTDSSNRSNKIILIVTNSSSLTTVSSSSNSSLTAVSSNSSSVSRTTVTTSRTSQHSWILGSRLKLINSKRPLELSPCCGSRRSCGPSTRSTPTGTTSSTERITTFRNSKPVNSNSRGSLLVLTSSNINRSRGRRF